MKKYFTLILVGWSFLVCGQNIQNDVRFFNDEEHANIQLSGFGYYGSSVLDDYTSQLFYKGGFFSESLKNESFARLKTMNYLGGEYGGQITFSNPLSTLFDDAGFYANYEVNGAAGVSFTDDLFKVVFQGNKDYIGKTAHLGPMEFSSFQYKKIGFGINQNDRIKMGIGMLSFDSWQKGKISQADMIMNENVDSIQLNVAGRYRNSALSSPAGLGLSFDFEAIFPLNGKNDSLDQTKLVVGIKNLGLFFSNKNMETYQIDSTYLFSGFNINSIADFQQSIINPSQLRDSLQPVANKNRITDLLPFEIYFYSTSRADGKKLQLIYGFRYRYGVGALPQVYAGADWRPKPKTIISNYLFCGGYAIFQWGLAIKKDFGKFKIGVSSNNLHGFLTKEAYSQSLGLTMSYAIK